MNQINDPFLSKGPCKTITKAKGEQEELQTSQGSQTLITGKKNLKMSKLSIPQSRNNVNHHKKVEAGKALSRTKCSTLLLL
jgi:hypothetical protein